MSSDHHHHVGDSTGYAMGLTPLETVPDSTQQSQPCAINTTAILFQHIPACFIALHLVYEVGIFVWYVYWYLYALKLD